MEYMERTILLKYKNLARIILFGLSK